MKFSALATLITLITLTILVGWNGTPVNAQIPGDYTCSTTVFRGETYIDSPEGKKIFLAIADEQPYYPDGASVYGEVYMDSFRYEGGTIINLRGAVIPYESDRIMGFNPSGDPGKLHIYTGIYVSVPVRMLVCTSGSGGMPTSTPTATPSPIAWTDCVGIESYPIHTYTSDPVAYKEEKHYIAFPYGYFNAVGKASCNLMTQGESIFLLPSDQHRNYVVRKLFGEGTINVESCDGSLGVLSESMDILNPNNVSISSDSAFAVDVCIKEEEPECEVYDSTMQHMHYTSPTAGNVYFHLQALCDDPFNVYSNNTVSGKGNVFYASGSSRTDTQVNCFGGSGYKIKIDTLGHENQTIRYETSAYDMYPWGTQMSEGVWYELEANRHYSVFASYFSGSAPYMTYPFSIEVCPADFDPDESPTPVPTNTPSNTPTNTPTGTQPPTPTFLPTITPTATPPATATPGEDVCPSLRSYCDNFSYEYVPTAPITLGMNLDGQVFRVIGDNITDMSTGQVLFPCKLYVGRSNHQFTTTGNSGIEFCIPPEDLPSSGDGTPLATLPNPTPTIGGGMGDVNVNVTANVEVNVTANVNVTVNNNVTVVVQMPTGTAYNPGTAPTAGTGVALAPGVEAIVAPTVNASPMPAWGIELPTSRALITPTLSTDIISGFERIDNDLATPAQIVERAATTFSYERGQAQAATMACMMEPARQWVTVINPDDARHELAGSVLWALAPILAPLSPILIVYFVVYLVKFVLWVAKWILALVNLVLSILKLIRG